MFENRNPYESPSEPGQPSAAPSGSKPWWTKNVFIFAAMMLAAYLILPALLLALGDGFLLGEFGRYGFQAPVVLLVFPWPLLLVYAIAILVVLSTTSSMAIRGVLGALALVVYTVAVFFWLAFAIAG